MPRWTCYTSTIYPFFQWGPFGYSGLCPDEPVTHVPYIIFFFSGVHWVIVAYAQMDFVLQYLKLIQFLVMAHYYWTLATRALRRERLTKWYVLYNVVRSHRRLYNLYLLFIRYAYSIKE